MAITYTWTISDLQRRVSDGAVVAAEWRCDAEDGMYRASTYSAASFEPDPASAGFIPYARLTESDVLAWVMGQEDFDKAAVETNLVTQIDAQKQPPVLAGTPWATESPE